MIGIAGNPRLEQQSIKLSQEAEKMFNKTKETSRLFGEFQYAAESWNKERRMIARVERNEEDLSVRYVLTNLRGSHALPARESEAKAGRRR